MSSEKDFNYSNNLNLLLKQQIINQLQEEQENSIRYEQEKDELQQFEDCIRIKRSTSTVFSRRVFEENTTNPKQDGQEIKIILANIQLEESGLAQQHKALRDHYDLQEQLLEHILQHIDCIILTIRSSNRLSITVNNYAVNENLITEQVSNSLKKLCEKPELDPLEQLRGKLMVTLNNYENIKQLRCDYEKRYNDYHLALKNFKIILEVMDVNEKSLRKLKQQFDDVLMNYQHCRCMLDQELPFIIAERTKVLTECFSLLGKDLQVWCDQTIEFSNLIKNLMGLLNANGYILVKKASSDNCSIDTSNSD